MNYFDDIASKDTWTLAFECAVENLAEELDISLECAESQVLKLISQDPNHLDSYFEFYKDMYGEA